MRRAGALHWLKHDVTHRGITAWLLSFVLFAFYLLLYFGDRIGHDPIQRIAMAMRLPSKWSLYGLLYTSAVLIGGGFVLRKYRHNRYQVVRTIVVMTVQTTLAFALPYLLVFLKQPEFYFSYWWPLKIEYFYPSEILHKPLFYVLWSVLGSLVLVPLLGLLFGKRWYCSWVCGCGGLANTAGDGFRQLSSKSTVAWRFEQVAIHSLLIICLLVTALAIVGSIGAPSETVRAAANSATSWYGFVVGALLSGVIGVGLYPIGGTRVWCRNFCPMAALLGLIQKAGRFRIRVKRDMCISCGLCSKYCEMGIDVRSYAQRNESFTRASCVGCGMCAEVCPRGVLALESPSRAKLVRIRTRPRD